MARAKPVSRLTFVERLNFLVTNRLPRRYLTLFMGWFSKIKNPLVCRLSIAVWKLFADDLRLEEAKEDRFSSLHDCFVRELKPGSRSVDQDPDAIVSPCDAVVGEFGDIDDLDVIQAKGYPYSIADLMGCEQAAASCRNGRFITLRLKSSMYHRFHAPADGRIGGIIYISGDTWNVNPAALKCVDRLFCKNERVAMPLDLSSTGESLVMVAVAAILVASIRLHGVEQPLNLRYDGPNEIALERTVIKGEELGYFEHGSTIVMLIDDAFEFTETLKKGDIVRMGQRLMTRRAESLQNFQNVSDTQT